MPPIQTNPSLPDHSSNISLLLQPNGVSFSICEKSGKKPFCQNVESSAQNRQEAVREAILSSGILEKTYNQVTIVAPTHLFVLLPEDSFDAEQISLYYSAVVGNPTGKRLLFQHLEELQMYLLFAVEEELYEFLSRSFIHPDIVHPLPALLTQLNAQTPQSETTMYVRHEAQLLTVVLFKEGRLLSATAFPCSTGDNALYYLLSLWKQFKCDQLNDKLYIVGEGDFREELLREAAQYIKQSAILLINKEML